MRGVVRSMPLKISEGIIENTTWWIDTAGDDNQALMEAIAR